MGLDVRALTILVVEDEPLIRDAFTRVLARQGHRVLGSATSSEALAITDRQHVDVVITDRHLPDGSGVELVRTIARHHPAIRVLIVTGDLDGEMSTRTLYKPVDGRELARAVERARPITNS